MKSIIVKDIPEQIHRRFKTACSAEGKSMSEVLRKFIDRRSSTLSVPLDGDGTVYVRDGAKEK